MSRRAPTRQARPPDSFGALGSVGSAVLVAAAVLVAVMVLADALGASPLRSAAVSAALLLGAALVGVAAYRLRHRDPGAGALVQVAAAVPALLVVGYAVAVRFLPVGRRDEWYLGGDHVRHAVMVAEEQAAGGLSYAAESYPRGWHTVVALVWSALGVRPDESVVTALDLGALLAWLLPAGLALTTAALAASLGARVGLSHGAAGAAGLVAGCITLWPLFLANYQALGLEASLVAGCVLAVVLREQLVDGGGWRALVVAAAGVVVVSHTWQLLLPVVGLAAIRSAVGVVRARRAAGATLVGALVLAVGLASWPALEAVVTRVGIEHASDADVVSPVPWVFLVLGGLAAGGVLARSATTRRAAVAGVLALSALPALTGLVLAGVVGVTPETYYPSKLLWHTALLGLAPLAVGVVALALRVDRARFRGSSLVRVLGGGGVAVVLLYAVLGPAAAFAGSWSTVDGPLVLRLLDTPGAGTTQVVWSDGPVVTDTVTRILLQAVDPQPGAERVPQESLTVPAECSLLAAAQDPGVLTNQPEAAVRERYACVPGLRVVRPPSGP